MKNMCIDRQTDRQMVLLLVFNVSCLVAHDVKA